MPLPFGRMEGDRLALSQPLQMMIDDADTHVK
jgi:hypothetical protein